MSFFGTKSKLKNAIIILTVLAITGFGQPSHSYNVADPLVTHQWFHQKINSPVAWNSSYGSGVLVAICDSSVQANHPDLSSNLLPGYDAVTQTSIMPAANKPFGTHVAGVIGAIANNGIGVAGVSFGAKILPVNIYTTSTQSVATAKLYSSRCIRYAADQGARVVVANSFNTYAGYSDMCDAVVTPVVSNPEAYPSTFPMYNASKYLKSKGGILIVGAGYSSNKCAQYGADAISVGSTNSIDIRVQMSRYNTALSLVAPGSGVVTTTLASTYQDSKSWMHSVDAIPSAIVGAVAALVLSVKPQLSSDQLTNILLSTAKDLGVTGWDATYGYGMIDANAAVLKAKPMP